MAQAAGPLYARINSGSTLQKVGPTGAIPIYINSLIIDCPSAGSVTFYEDDGTTIIFTVSLAANSTIFNESNSMYLPRGLKVTTSNNAACTIFYSRV